MCELEPQFLQYIQVELQFAAQSVAKYQDCLRQIRKVIGDRPVTAYGREDVLRLKSDMIARSLSVCRQVGILSAFKRLLLFCREQLALPVLEPDAVSIPKRPRREVVLGSGEVCKQHTANDTARPALNSWPALSGSGRDAAGQRHAHRRTPVAESQ
jgi:hypothetical protein